MSATPVAVPAIALAFGYMIVFNADLAPWLGSMPLLIAAHAILTLPYLTNTLLTDLRHLDLDRLEQAAATLGASGWQQFGGIVRRVAPEPDQRAGDEWRRSRSASSACRTCSPASRTAPCLVVLLQRLLRRRGLRLRGHRHPPGAGERVGASFLPPLVKQRAVTP